TAPTASVQSALDLIGHAPSYIFAINYTGANPIDTTTIGNDDVTVTFASGMTEVAQLMSTSTNGNTVTATYSVGEPNDNATFSSIDNGSATISINSSSVFDMAGLAVPAGNIGSFFIDILESGIDLTLQNVSFPSGTFTAGQFASGTYDVTNLGDT